MAVRHQVLVARAEETPETGQVALSHRQAMAQARQAGRTARKEAIAARQLEAPAPQAKPARPVVRVKPAIQHRLSVDGLVTLSKPAVGFRLGTEKDPYVSLQKGTVGVLVALVSGRSVNLRARRIRQEQLCHVMTPMGIVELPVGVVRSCDEDEA